MELGLRWGQEGPGPLLPEDAELGHEAVREGVFVGAQGALALNVGGSEASFPILMILRLLQESLGWKVTTSSSPWGQRCHQTKVYR